MKVFLKLYHNYYNYIIDYLKEGLDTPPLSVWNFGPSMKLGVYFKTHCDETIKDSHVQLCISLQLGLGLF